jgi:hypothetical protein
MKNLILTLFLVLTSNLFVSGQTYAKFKSPSGDVSIEATSRTTAVLRFENANGYVTTKYLTLSGNSSDVKRWNCSDGSYVTTEVAPFDRDPFKQAKGLDSYLVTYYNSLDRKLWDSVVN